MLFFLSESKLSNKNKLKFFVENSRKVVIYETTHLFHLLYSRANYFIKREEYYLLAYKKYFEGFCYDAKFKAHRKMLIDFLKSFENLVYFIFTEGTAEYLSKGEFFGGC